MKKIKIILMLIFVAFNLCVKAQTVGYSHKALAAEGCYIKYSVTKQDSTYYIIVTVRSDRLNFLKESTFLLKTFDGDIIKLRGEVIGNASETGGIISGNIVIPVTAIYSTAQFKITPEQFELLNKGISKVRLSTTPIEHERTFKKDKIGKKLYQFYLKKKSQNNEF